MSRTSDHKQRVYGRRQGRPLNLERQQAVDELMPKLGINKELVTENADIVPYSLFSKEYKQIWMEIGFGNGEHLKGLMERHPDHGFIGGEPFVNGMAAFLRSIYETEHDNVRVWMDDAIRLVDSLTDHSLDGLYVLNPDPWPKKRHHKRRIINTYNMDRFARVLKPGASLIMATDVDDLAEWMAIHASNHDQFEWTASSSADWKTMPQDWIRTRYEEKGEQEGRKQSYLIFKRV